MEQPQRPFTPYNAPIKDAKLLPTQAPAQMFGRNRELGSGHVALKAGTAVMLYGPAGIGKSATAAVLAAAYTVQHPGGVLWFNMTEDDSELLLARVGRAYGVNALTTTQSQEDPADQISVIRALLERNRPLIVLDGLTDVEAVRDFARSAGAGIPMIITNEAQAAGPWTPIPLKPLAAADSISLLRALSGLKDAAYTQDLEGLARVLEGDPLSLGLAARHIAAEDVPPAELLVNYLAAVPSGAAMADPQQTILSVVYKKLPPAVQGIFLILGVTFGGSASAELVSDLSGVPAPTVAPVMRQMVIRGLAHESVTYGQLTFTLHESVQTFARHTLESTGRLQAVENRAMQAVLAYTIRHARPETAEHDRLAAEIDNIMGAAAFATSTGQEQVVRQFLHAISQEAGDFVTLRGFQPELSQLRKLLLLLVRTEQPSSGTLKAMGQPARSTQTLYAALPSEPISDPEPIADELPDTQSAAPVDILDEPPPQPELAPEPVAETQPETLPPDEPVAPIPEPPISFDAEATPPPQSTKPVPAQDVTPVEELPELHSEITELDLLDNPHLAEPKQPEPTVVSSLFKSVQPAPPPPTPAPASPEITQTPTVYSIGTLQSKISEAQADSDQKAQARYLEMLGDAYAGEGDAPRAIDVYVRAVELSRGGENWQAIGLLMGKLGNAYLDAGRPQESIMMLEQALTIFRRERRADYEARILGTLGSAYGETRNWAKAREYHEQALYLARERADRLDEATQLGNLAYISQLQNARDGAVTYYRQALHLAYQLRNDSLRGDYAFQLGRLLLDDGRTVRQAEKLLTDADTLIPGDTEIERLLKRARKRLEHLSGGGVTIPAAVSNEQYAADAYTAVAH